MNDPAKRIDDNPELPFIRKRKHQRRRYSLSNIRTVFLLFFALISVICFGISYTAAHIINREGESSLGEGSLPVYAKETSDYERVINRTYPIEPGYIAGTGELKTIQNSGGKQMEKNAAISLEHMIDGLESAGMSVIVRSAYRTVEDQEYLYSRQIERRDGNELEAAVISTMPLASEHQAGLAVDLSVDGKLNNNFADTDQGKWLLAHCAEYGFIHRYGKDKTHITGIVWEPWHFRYVGSPEVAKAIMASGKCMEEYYGKYLSPEDLEPYLPYLDSMSE